MYVNRYPVQFKDFIRIKGIGIYPIMYCMLDDRIHFEMPIENSIFCTQKYIDEIEEEVLSRTGNYDGDKKRMFMKIYFGNSLCYQYYPEEEDKSALEKIKLYSEYKIVGLNTDLEPSENMKIEQKEDSLRIYSDNRLYLEAEKVR